MVLLDFSMFPIGKGESLSPHVARVLDIVDRSGLPYRCHAMGTVLEGEFDQVIDVVRKCFQALAEDCDRIECSIRIDYRKDRVGGLDGKLASVERRLGRPLNK